MDAEPKTLEIGLPYHVPAYGCIEGFPRAPRGAAFSIDRATAEQIVKLATIVSDNQLNAVEKFDYRVTWLKYSPDDSKEDWAEDDVFDLKEESDARLECDCLHVSDTDFWFSGLGKYSGAKIETGLCDIETLARHFKLGGLL